MLCTLVARFWHASGKNTDVESIYHGDIFAFFTRPARRPKDPQKKQKRRYWMQVKTDVFGDQLTSTSCMERRLFPWRSQGPSQCLSPRRFSVRPTSFEHNQLTRPYQKKAWQHEENILRPYSSVGSQNLCLIRGLPSNTIL